MATLGPIKRLRPCPRGSTRCRKCGKRLCEVRGKPAKNTNAHLYCNNGCMKAANQNS